MKLLFSAILLLFAASSALGQTLWSRAKINSNNEDKYGIILADGSWLIDPIYDDIRAVSVYVYEGRIFFLAEQDGKYGLFDHTGKSILPTEFHSINVFRRYLKVDSNGKFGAYSLSGNKILEANYPRVTSSSYEHNVHLSPYDQYIAFGDDGQLGVIDTSGQVIIPPMYDRVQSGGAFFLVHKDGKPSLYNQLGAKLNTANFTEFHKPDYSPDGYIYGRSDGKWGVLDSLGNVILEPHYSEVDMRNSHIKLESDEKKGVALFSGKVILKPIYDDIDYDQDHKFFKFQLNDKWGVTSIDGTTILPLEYDQVYLLPDYIECQINGKYGACDYDGQVILSAECDSIVRWRPTFRYRKDGKWGMISTNKKQLIPLEYDEIETDDDLLLARLKDQYDGFNFDGFQLFSSVDEVKSFRDLHFLKKNNRWSAVNKEGIQVIAPLYTEIGTSLRNDRLPVKKNGKWGYISSKGEVMIPFIYDDAENFDYDGARVSKNGKSFRIDKNNKIIVYNNNPFGDGGSGGGMGSGFGSSREPTTPPGVELSYHPNLKIFKDNSFIGITEKEQVLLPAEFTELIVSEHPIILARKDALWGAFDLSGKMIFEPAYSELTNFLAFDENGFGFLQGEGIRYSFQEARPVIVENPNSLIANNQFYVHLEKKRADSLGYYPHPSRKPVYQVEDQSAKEFIEANIIYPRKAKKLKEKTTVVVNCIVDAKGVISFVEFEDPKMPSYLLEEAKRVILEMERWIPAKYNSNFVPAQIAIPIVFDPAVIKRQ